MRCIVIDVGNTSTGIARYQDGRVSHIAHINGGIRRQPEACQQALLRAAGKAVDGAVLGSVVPQVNGSWKSMVRRVAGVPLLVVGASTPMAVRVDYPRPKTIGPDRLANACGGVARYGAPLIVADFGTALTFDIVTADCRYIGGVIAPGLPLMTDYLFERTALLPRLKLGGVCPRIGRSTKGAMRIGAHIGYRGMVREIVNYLRQSSHSQPHLCATGGYARWAIQGLDMPFVIDPTLTLFGLGCIFEAQGGPGDPQFSLGRRNALRRHYKRPGTAKNRL
ncbi:MAG: type III pantothenate kinase, partial [Kiritimatiellia bacterium]